MLCYFEDLEKEPILENCTCTIQGLVICFSIRNTGGILTKYRVPKIVGIRATIGVAVRANWSLNRSLF